MTKFLPSFVHYHGNVAIDLCDSNLNQQDVLHVSRILYFIEHLYLSSNPIGDTGASLISEAIRKTTTLKTLILHDCDITSRGAEDLSRALTQNTSLEKLDIGLNSLKDNGISHVAEALKQSKQLKELWISQCGMTDEGATSLASALTINNSLQMLHMGGDGGFPKGGLTVDGVSAIAHVLAYKSMFIKLAIPASFGPSTVNHLSQEVNEARKRIRLPPIEIEGEYIVCCRDVLHQFVVFLYFLYA